MYAIRSYYALYAFGHGLSYSTFEYSNLKVNVISKDEVQVSFVLKNTGSVKGKEVAQLYIQDLYASITRPVLELKGFELIELEPNESKVLTFKLTDKELGFYDNEGQFIVELGEFNIYIGGSSKPVLRQKFELQ